MDDLGVKKPSFWKHLYVDLCNTPIFWRILRHAILLETDSKTEPTAMVFNPKWVEGEWELGCHRNRFTSCHHMKRLQNEIFLKNELNQSDNKKQTWY